MSNVLPVYPRSDLEFTHGEGVYLFDNKGSKYLDLAAGIAVNSMGHSHPHLVKALQEQAGKLWHVSNMYKIEGLEKLAKRICDATDFADYAFFCNSGAEAVECGLKMIRKYQHSIGNPQKFRVITFDGAFHGRTLAGIAAGNKPKLTDGYTPLMDGFDQVPFNDVAALKAAITPETGGIIIEPIQGEGGIRVCPDEFLQTIRTLCDENDLVLMYDGVQCGMGRTGKFFSHEWQNVKPDVVSSAKGIGGGFPLGACLSNHKVGQYMQAGSHGSTYGNNPLGVAVGNAVMDLILADGFLDNVIETGNYFIEKLDNLRAQFPTIIKSIRGRGLMIGVELTSDSKDFVVALRKKNILTAPAAENVVRLLPPLTLEKSHVDEGMEKITELCQEMA